VTFLAVIFRSLQEYDRVQEALAVVIDEFETLWKK
jgi:hypothetical protein